MIVALNWFTLEAKQLAFEHNIDIVHDENLAVMIAGLADVDQGKVQAMLDDETKHCPKCESVMEGKLRAPVRVGNHSGDAPVSAMSWHASGSVGLPIRTTPLDQTIRI